MFALVEDGNIELYAELPQNWRNVSNLSALASTDLNALGWYGVATKEKPSFDAETHTVESVVTLDPVDDYVVQSWTIRALTANELAGRLDARKQQARVELMELDRFIPRGLEDTWAATGFDLASLSQIQRDRLDRKSALRAIIGGA